MTVSIRVPRLRSLALVLIGAALGATLIAPVAARVTGPSAGSDAAVTTTHTRSASCAGLSFYPTDSATTYSNDGTMRFRTYVSPGGGTGVFRCDPGLPTGAVVTKVHFTLFDEGEPFMSVDGCNLRRSGLTVARATTAETLASVPSTGTTAIPGVVRLSTTAIQFATIDNAKYGYWFECHLNGAGNTDIGIFGADAIYTITAAKG